MLFQFPSFRAVSAGQYTEVHLIDPQQTASEWLLRTCNKLLFAYYWVERKQYYFTYYLVITTQ